MAKRKKRRGARRTTRRARFRKGSAAAKRYMASIRPKGGTVARRRKGHRRTHKNAAVKHRRHFRRNPSLRGMGGGVLRALTKGAKCGAFITLGEATSVAVPGMIGLPTTGLLGYAARLGVGTAVAVLGKGVLGAEGAEYFVGGVFAGVYRQLIRQFNVPILAPALAGYPGPVALKGYPTRRAAVAPAGTRTGLSAARVGGMNLF